MTHAQPRIVALVAAGCDVGLIGRKAASLSELTAYGLPVPEAYALTVAGYHELLAAPSLAPLVEAYRQAPPEDKPAAAGAVRAAMATTPWPPPLEEELRRFYHGVGFAGVAIAVRGSGIHEALGGASFAGLFDTRLNVRTEADFLAAVRACWASAWAPEPLSRAHAHGLDAFMLGMGVVVQRLVEAEVSGVLFTLDPESAHPDRMRIASCFGLGEALVSGRVQPDTYLVERRTGEVVESACAHKQIRLGYAEGGRSGLVEIPLDLSEATRPTLAAADLAAVAALGRQVQAHYGMPMDVEWALDPAGRLYLLQARPITALAFAELGGAWSAAGFGDGGAAARVCTPFAGALHAEAWRGAIASGLAALGLPAPAGAEWVRGFYGRPYWNLEAACQALAALPGFEAAGFARAVGLAAPPAVPAAPRGFFARLRDGARRRAAHRAVAEAQARSEAFVAGLRARLAAYDAPPPDADAALAERLARLGADYAEATARFAGAALATGLAEGLLAARLAGAEANVAALIGGQPGLRHLAPALALTELAAEALSDRVFAEFLVDQPPERLHAQLVPAGFAPWRAKLDTYLARYGHHAPAEADLMQPRWSEDPGFVAACLQRAVVLGLTETAALKEAERRQQAAAAAERGDVESRLGARGAKGFAQALDQLRRAVWWREEVRDGLTRFQAVLRREALVAGERLAARGLLEVPLDVFFLLPGELAAALREPAPEAEALRARVADRRLEFWGYRSFVHPEALGSASMEPAPAGVGVCGGDRVRGVARVVSTIQEATRLAPGEILVTRTLDPGWAPLLVGLGGLVTEAGGLLSTAGVLARESGVPAIVGLRGALAAVPDGALVELDPAAGTVKVLPPEEGELTGRVPEAAEAPVEAAR